MLLSRLKNWSGGIVGRVETVRLAFPCTLYCTVPEQQSQVLFDSFGGVAEVHSIMLCNVPIKGTGSANGLCNG